MTYLITEFAIYFAAATLIGFLTAWILQAARLRRCRRELDQEMQDHDAVVEELSEQIQRMEKHLDDQANEGTQTVGRVAEEIERMRPLLESLSNGMEQSAQDMNADRESRQRAEQATRELEEIQEKFQKVLGENKSLRQNFEKVAEKISGYEQERFAAFRVDTASPDAARPTTDRASAPEPPKSKPAPKPKSSSAFEGLPALERSEDPFFGSPNELERDTSPRILETPLTAGPDDAEESPKSSAPAEPTSSIPSSATRGPGGEPTGATRPLRMIPDLPEDVIARMELLGLKTNLDLLQKCDSHSGVSALSKSMGLGKDVISRWVAIADLLRLECVRKDDFNRLIEVGVQSVDDLATSSARDLAQRLRDEESTGDTPPLETVAKWINEAVGLVAVHDR